MTPRIFVSAFLGMFLLFQFQALNILNAAVFNPERFTLANGLQVVVVTNRRAPVVSHMIWYKVGAADEPRGKSGIAHFLEHLMFKGTKSLLPGEFSRIVMRNGGRDNAFTSQDYTAYFQEVAREKLELVMRLEADRMRGLVLTDKEVLPEREVILEERRTRTDNNPGSQLWEAARAALFLNHPYKNPVIGWKHEIKKLTTKDALEFYNRYYYPNNAILIVAGDISSKELRPLAEKYYGVVDRGPHIIRKRIKEPMTAAGRRVELSSNRAGQPSISLTFVTPSYVTARGSRAYALQVLAEILGGGPTSYLYRELVVQRGVASSASAWANLGALDYGTFGLFAAPRLGTNIGNLETELLNTIKVFLKSGVSEKQLARAVNSMIANAVYARDSLSAAPNIIGQALSTGLTISDVEDWPERVKSVTVDDVNEAAKEVLRSEISVTAILRKKKTGL